MRPLGVVLAVFLAVPPVAAVAQESVRPAAAGDTFETRHFVINGNFDELILPITELGPLFDEVYDYVSARVGVGFDATLARPAVYDKILVTFTDPGGAGAGMGCPQRGRAAAYGVEIFADTQTSETQLLAVLAHEVGHVLTFSWLGTYPISTMPAEGFATWAAGRFMADWYGIPSLEAGAALLVTGGGYVSISEPVGTYYTLPADFRGAEPAAEGCLERRDRLYTEWGAFMAYLVDEFGQERLHDLLQSVGAAMRADLTSRLRVSIRSGESGSITLNRPSLSPADELDYQVVYDSPLPALEKSWLESLARPHPSP